MRKNFLFIKKLNLFLVLIFTSQFLSAAQGDLDTTFNPTGTPPGTVQTDIGTEDIINSIAIQSDGKIVAGGYSTNAGVSRFTVARYNTNGSLDTSFGTNGVVQTTINGINDEIFSIELQEDGKIVAGGFTTVSGGGDMIFALARYNTNGSLDTSFGTNGIVQTIINGFDDEIRSIKIQQDGKFVAGGFTKVSGGGDIIFALVRYNIDGSLDTSFGANGIVQTNINGVNDAINSIAIQSDGKIVAGGFTLISGIGKFAVARYNTNGSLDTTFNSSGTVQGVVQTQINSSASIGSIALQSDGKIIAGGSTTISGVIEFALARYNTDGSLDTTFNPSGTIPGVVQTNVNNINDQINSVAMQSDGKIVVGGVTRNGAIRLFAIGRYNSDGSLDTTFGSTGTFPGIVQTQIGTLAIVNSIVIQSDNKIVAAGFSRNPADNQFTIARYLASSTLIQSNITIAIKNKYCDNGAGA